MSDITLTDLGNMIGEIMQEFPHETENAVKKVGLKVRRKFKEAAPEGATGNLKKKWSGKLGGYYGDVEYQVSSKSPHFHLVERGHEVVTPGGRRVGFKQGTHFAEKAAQEIIAEGTLKNELEKMLRRLRRG